MDKNEINMRYRAMGLDENDEWVEVPLENAVPKWLYDSLSKEDEDDDIAYVFPYLEKEFHQWLMDVRGISQKSADDYIRHYESAYDHLYEEVGINLYALLQSIFEGDKYGISLLTKEDAPDLVKIYLDEILERIDEQEDSYTKAELRAIASYHAFFVDMAGTEEETYVKEKSTPLPEEEEFKDWLETEFKMDNEKIGKIVSSIRRMELILPSLVTEPMSFLEVLRALPTKSKRQNYVALVSKQKRHIYRNSKVSYSTIQKGLSNIKIYINFLNRNIV